MPRPALLLSVALGLGACQSDPSFHYLGGIGDPVRGAALHAPQNLGDTSRYAGRPAEAALAAAQLEFLDAELRRNPRYAPEIDPSVTQRLGFARSEMRAQLGIRQDAPPETVIPALRAVHASLAAGSPARAEAALAGPDFPAGGAATLARLATLPRLPRTAEAAGGVAAEFDRLDRRR